MCRTWHALVCICIAASTKLAGSKAAGWVNLGGVVLHLHCRMTAWFGTLWQAVSGMQHC